MFFQFKNKSSFKIRVIRISSDNKKKLIAFKEVSVTKEIIVSSLKIQ